MIPQSAAPATKNQFSNPKKTIQKIPMEKIPKSQRTAAGVRFEVMSESKRRRRDACAGAAASRRRTRATRAPVHMQAFAHPISNGRGFASSGGGTPPLLGDTALNRTPAAGAVAFASSGVASVRVAAPLCFLRFEIFLGLSGFPLRPEGILNLEFFKH
ncbi:hypothetical protein OH491_16050 [Termitidicoccus mucosus]